MCFQIFSLSLRTQSPIPHPSLRPRSHNIPSSGLRYCKDASSSGDLISPSHLFVQILARAGYRSILWINSLFLEYFLHSLRRQSPFLLSVTHIAILPPLSSLLLPFLFCSIVQSFIWQRNPPKKSKESLLFPTCISAVFPLYFLLYFSFAGSIIHLGKKKSAPSNAFQGIQLSL